MRTEKQRAENYSEEYELNIQKQVNELLQQFYDHDLIKLFQHSLTPVFVVCAAVVIYILYDNLYLNSQSRKLKRFNHAQRQAQIKI
mmetsp:Transcript_8653/g.14658  ORF Transcript_8653/g.14658 Transcript_8653/m.14658 type:complete len:86 (+) Transcript_8653:732-989(+)